MRGCIHIYCGDGKGKTTAAVGLSVRAAGRGMRVLMARFLKTEDSGEVVSLKKLPGIKVYPCEQSFGFYWNMTEEEKQQAAVYYTDLLEHLWQEAVETSADLVVLDEIMAACNHQFVSYGYLKELLLQKPEAMEVVLTGRNPESGLIDMADYVTEMCSRKHPYDLGIPARPGIEY